MLKPLGFLPLQTTLTLMIRWRTLRLQCKYKKELGESYGIKFDRLSWPVFLAGVLPHLEGVVTELGSGWNESLGLHFCISKHLNKIERT